MNVQDLAGQTVGLCASGGLDSCVATHWLTNHGVEVVTFTADLGQPNESDLSTVAERMRSSGAVEAVIVPLKEQLAEAGLMAIQAQATYEGGYWNTTPLGRQVTVQGVLPYMIERDIGILSHGSTGRGNDQIRIQIITNMLLPGMEVYAPWRDPYFLDNFNCIENMVRYCDTHDLPVVNHEPEYTTDANLLGMTHEAGELAALTTPGNFVEPAMGMRATDAPDIAEKVSITFDKGRPVAINGETVASMADVFERLNASGGRNGVGINLHLVENRFVGTKSRGIYEAPGMEVLGRAYAYLLQLVLDRRSLDFFEFVSSYLGRQLYQSYGLDLGSQLAVDAATTVAQYVCGTISMELYKGNTLFLSAVDMPHSLYSEEHALMMAEGAFEHSDSEGLLKVLGVGARAAAKAGQVRNPFV